MPLNKRNKIIAHNIDKIILLYKRTLGIYIPLRIVKYLSVGMSGVFVNQGALYYCRSISTSDSTAIMAGIELSIISNFILNNLWTFSDYKLNSVAKVFVGLITFHFVCLAGSLINYSIAMLLSSQWAVNIYAANGLGIFISALWNYRMNFQITWKHRL